jgi:adenylosuccinate synthase
MIDYVDVIYGLAWGDEGKGKISNALAPKMIMFVVGTVDQMLVTLFM